MGADEFPAAFGIPYPYSKAEATERERERERYTVGIAAMMLMETTRANDGLGEQIEKDDCTLCIQPGIFVATAAFRVNYCRSGAARSRLAVEERPPDVSTNPPRVSNGQTNCQDCLKPFITFLSSHVLLSTDMPMYNGVVERRSKRQL